MGLSLDMDRGVDVGGCPPEVASASASRASTSNGGGKGVLALSDYERYAYAYDGGGAPPLGVQRGQTRARGRQALSRRRASRVGF